ncbi:late competence protein ComER [Lederbergia graminis]|uniref:Late competence protein ComER n=1 Tax=Lederbergia graminis TaxID=735518 RepID=A0ABW0LL85_9BACI
MKIGIIGTGNMGTILSEALLDAKSVSPSDLIVINRTKAKAERLKDRYKDIVIANNIEELIVRSDLIFLCIKPADFYSLLLENKDFFNEEKCIVSITSPIQPDWLESLVNCSCARIIPSITNRAHSGVTLFTFGNRCSELWKNKLNTLFSAVSLPLEINEEITRVSSDIVSCGPAFFSYLTRRFIEAAVSETAIDEETATILSEQMLIGLGELLKKGYYSLPTLEEKVCVKGGITGEGINVLENEVGDMFEKLFQATHAKFNDEKSKLERDFNS